MDQPATLINITVIDRQGNESDVSAKVDISLKDCLRDQGYEILAICDGCCSCGTCHVYIDTDESTQFDTPSEAEESLVELLEYKQINSRLSCQLPFDESLDGARITLAPEES